MNTLGDEVYVHCFVYGNDFMSRCICQTYPIVHLKYILFLVCHLDLNNAV